MDKETRFLLASKVSENRDANGAITAFQEAIKNANGNLPDTVKTDAPALTEKEFQRHLI
jgi:hypothetical protein